MPPLTLDHIIIAARDLGEASAELSRALGRAPSWRGRHPSYGTANVLFRLASSYIELLAPDPDATSDSAWTGSLGTFLSSRGPGLFSIALRTPDVVASTARARERGLPVEEPLPGSGRDLDTNAVREWVNARIPPESTRGTRTFFITHKSPPDALPRSALTADLEAVAADTIAVIAASTDVEGARVMWREVFELPESPRDEGWRFDLGNATLLLRPGPQSGDPPDRWESLVVSVPDLAKVQARLKTEGVAIEPAADPYRGVAVRACGARIVLTEGK